MQWTDQIRRVRIALVVAAVLLAFGSLYVSHLLVKDLSLEEQGNVGVWAEAMRSLNTADETTDLSLVLKVLNGNDNIPVVVLDSEGEVQEWRNLSVKGKSEDEILRDVRRKARDMEAAGNVIRVDEWRVCFGESLMLRRLAWYPYAQLTVVIIFVLVALFALLTSKKAEQNRVWVGLSKETAHQLGTPISSLMAWVEVLKESYPQDQLIPEMDRDVRRLQCVAERFSKIGSLPEAKAEDIRQLLGNVVQYIRPRTSDKVVIECRLPGQPLVADLCATLFEWVVENLCKNAIDAMEGKGRLVIEAREEESLFSVEVSDTGKGIPAKYLSTVFMPGFTTKKRGWGLGLSLAKRIIEEYHRGRIFVKSSEPGRGTTFRIELRKPGARPRHKALSHLGL
ncbi:MAG: HAMP domain-containing histidine kinase [Prevotellaceae bacterium]|nr:HAMP domain-containing histidine kinase [Prevotellaceae bacterium]